MNRGKSVLMVDIEVLVGLTNVIIVEEEIM